LPREIRALAIRGEGGCDGDEDSQHESTQRPEERRERQERGGSRAAGQVRSVAAHLQPRPVKGTETDWGYQDALTSGALTAVAAPPASVDLRAAWWAIDDQEDTGSCVGWATAEGVVRYHMVAAGRLPRAVLLSPRFVWMGSKETDEFTVRPETFIEGAGTSLKAAMDVARKYGAVPMSALPFHITTKMYMGDENSFYATASGSRGSPRTAPSWPA